MNDLNLLPRITDLIETITAQPQRRLAEPYGEEVGGSFKHMPLCRSADQIGCVITYMTFRSAVGFTISKTCTYSTSSSSWWTPTT